MAGNSTAQRSADGETARRAGAKWAILGISVGASVAAVLTAATSGLAAFYARQIVVPVGATEELEILHVSGFDDEMTVLLPADDETTVNGVYSLWFDEGRGHARIGNVIEYDPTSRTVLREVLGVDSGDLRAARIGRWNGTYYRNPQALQVPSEDVVLHTDAGDLPAWYIPGDPSAVAAEDAEATEKTWAILIHGRGGTRAEGLRAVPTLRAAGISSLSISYRNDPEARSGSSSRYGLGDTEWLDVDDAIEFAISRGAERVVLFGWSMGGAIAFQAAARGRYKDRISGMVLDAPVVDWFSVLDEQARINRLPTPIARLALEMISQPWARWITGLETPLDLNRMDWVTRAAELRVPVLLIHSDDDDFVPSGPSHRLATVRSDLVTMPRYDKARHTKEWNVDAERWSDDVRSFLQKIVVSDREGSASVR
ncbi:alpha/beta fold hydrolase [Saxibacter everestensis]|uniref:Alpha/beta fold hydrolase n=1 Tax=Saxibacter everestensis TaxID=2909229 RepID=A0ABY8QY42_9MICO|nr:alpha/beta fold hydrolase [Brevibacteriaceae bacterium ZFBP1038]